ncbi:MAG: ATP-binding protein [bacterium]
MNVTIRARLTIWYTLAFSVALLLVLGVLALETKQQFDEEIERALRTEERWLVELFESRFLGLLALQGRAYATLDSVLHEELEERYGLKRQFGLIAVKRHGETVLFHGGLRKAPELLPHNSWEKAAGNYEVRLDGQRYLVRFFHRSWGEVAVGSEEETVYRIAHEAAEVLIWMVPLALLFAVAGGWLLAKLALRPVVAAARKAESISLASLSERLPAYSGKDEFGTLCTTLNGMLARVEEGIKRLQQFTQDAAHELRTPLTVLRGELELAYQNESTTEETRAWAQRILDRVIALGRIVDNLRLLARSDSGDYPIHKAPFRIDVAVKEVFEDLQILAEGRPVAVQFQNPEAMVFSGDELLMRRLLLNLCDNALKYTPQGRIELSLCRNDADLSITLHDTGIGIPAEDLPHIFDRFYRVDKSRSSATGGSGLGLAICKWIVAAHRGEINIASAPGQGTTVRVHLPLAS